MRGGGNFFDIGLDVAVALGSPPPAKRRGGVGGGGALEAVFE
jgi:hypothetical protein